MYALKQLLVLALASSAFAICQCRKGGAGNGQIFTDATQKACTHSGGTIRNAGTDSVQCEKPCHESFDAGCKRYGAYETHDFGDVKSTCGSDRAWCKPN